MLNKSVIKVLKNGMWNLATCADGELVDTFKAMVEKMFNGAATAKGALIITPVKVIVTTPGAENKKEI